MLGGSAGGKISYYVMYTKGIRRGKKNRKRRENTIRGIK
jgi:hypothetical protein